MNVAATFARIAVPSAAGSRWLPSVTLVIFWITCIVTGGSARADAPYLLLLRMVTVTCLFVFLLNVTSRTVRLVCAPLLLLGSFALTAAIQLVPLPPGLWRMLPGRAPFANGLALVSAAHDWLPISVAPDRTWDTLIGLMVPLTALLGYAAVDMRTRALTLPGILAVGFASMMLGAGQVAGGEHTSLRLYEKADHGFLIGFFANKNHQSLFLVILLPILKACTFTVTHLSARARQAIMVVAGVTVSLAVVVTGSRAGLMILPLGLLAATLIGKASSPKRDRAALARIGLMAIAVVLAGLAIWAVLQSGRAIAVDRLLSANPINDERFTNAGVVAREIQAAFPVGWGYGTFDLVFRTFEPASSLHMKYFNNAHNDLLELLFTGGLGGAVILFLFMGWLGRSARASISRSVAHRSSAASTTATWRPHQGITALAAIIIVLLASLIDYPLHTPLFAAIFALLCAWLSEHSADAGMTQV